MPAPADTDPPLLHDAAPNAASQSRMEFDEDGSLALARALRALDSADSGSAVPATAAGRTPCNVGVLNGSWYLQLAAQAAEAAADIRGPMRIEIAPPKLRVSGDVYVRKRDASAAPALKPITDHPLLFGTNWYPQFPLGEYAWYFRSVGVTYQAGKLVMKLERTMWNPTTQEFINQENSGKDSGFMQLDCFEESMVADPLLPQATLRLTGTAHLGGETYDAVATKTSPFYRGCAVEVDVMTDRRFPMSATTVDGAVITFASIYRDAGIDCAVTVDQTNLPNDTQLTTVELQTALATNRRPSVLPDAWRLWLMVGSRQGALFGLMFDDVEPFREGSVGFYDPVIVDDPAVSPAARNKKLGEVPEAFLRTLVHEAGHAFNLFHPKSDVHNVPIGTTIMNQTGDVMQFATEAKPYPANITFAFEDHNRSSLIHSPDPQVAPGWKRFGWGHGSLSSGVNEPVDAADFLRGSVAPADLTLDLQIPDHIYRGQFVTAQFVLTNVGSAPREVTTAMNLSQGDLRLLVTSPGEELQDVRDVIVACGDRAYTTLQPGQSITGSAQIFYTNVGLTFRQLGRHLVSAELDIGEGTGHSVKSGAVPVVVRAPNSASEEEIARLAMHTAVGRAFAFGDFGSDTEAKARLDELAARYGDSDSGMAAALTLANAASRDLTDLYSGRRLRSADHPAAERHFRASAQALMAGDARKLAHFVVAIAAPTEANAPVLDLADAFLQSFAAEQATEPTSTAGGAGPEPREPRLLAEWHRLRDARASRAAAARGALERLRDLRRAFARGR